MGVRNRSSCGRSKRRLTKVQQDTSLVLIACAATSMNQLSLAIRRADGSRRLSLYSLPRSGRLALAMSESLCGSSRAGERNARDGTEPGPDFLDQLRPLVVEMPRQC